MTPVLEECPDEMDDRLFEALKERCFKGDEGTAVAWAQNPMVRKIGRNRYDMVCTNGIISCSYKLENPRMFAYERREDLDSLDELVMAHLANTSSFDTDFYTLLEWCRIGTEGCEHCEGEGKCPGPWRCSLLDSALAHAGYLASSPVDRRWLEFALMPYWVLEPGSIRIWPGRKRPEHVPHVILGEGWQICVGVLSEEINEALVFNYMEST